MRRFNVIGENNKNAGYKKLFPANTFYTDYQSFLDWRTSKSLPENRITLDGHCGNRADFHPDLSLAQ